MVQTADVVIIGAGFGGAATAYHLAARGVKDIVLLEREPLPGMHASGRNAALSFQLLADPTEDKLAAEGAGFIANPPEGFATAPLLRRTGSLLVCGPAGVPALEAAHVRAVQQGIAAERIGRDEALRRVPLLANAGFTAAFWNPADGVVDIHALLKNYLSAACTAGARTEFHRTVTRVTVERGHVTGVETDHGVLHTGCVVNAAGAWAGEVGQLAGVGARTLAPRRRHLFQATLRSVRIAPDWPFVWHNDIDVYFRPESGGLLMSPCDATPHPPRAPEVDPSMEERLHDKLARAFPAVAAAHVTSAWACLRTFAADERFVIGPDPALDGLIWVAALGGHGMTTSAAVGRLGAAAVLKEPLPELAGLSPARLT